LFEAGKDQGAGIAGPILIAISVTGELQLWRYNIVLSMAGGMIVHVTLATTITTGELLMFENRASRSYRTNEEVGFVGLGVMGQPMALNLAKAGTRLIVWNRTLERTDPLRTAGAVVASTIDDVFARTRIVIFMLVNETVTDSVLGRGTQRFAELVYDHVVVSMGSTAPD
jgi:hypothetical protein